MVHMGLIHLYIQYLQYFRKIAYIRNFRNTNDGYRPIGQHRRRNQGNRRILTAGDRYFSIEPVSPFNLDYFWHMIFLSASNAADILYCKGVTVQLFQRS